MNTAIASPSGASAGVGFAIPVDTIQRVVPQLLRYGKVVRPVLGAEYFPDTTTRQVGLSGVLIGNVTPGGPADQAGLQPTRRSPAGDIQLGDLIIALDGKAVVGVEELFAMLEERQPGDKVKLTVVRNPRTADQERLAVEVTLAEPNDKE
jgi:S1-C subfamily serine protease